MRMCRKQQPVLTQRPAVPFRKKPEVCVTNKKSMNQPIIVQQVVNAPIEKVWNYWTTPEHITQWNNASDAWYTPHAVSELTPGGSFTYRMEARDGSVGFDFNGTYDSITPNEAIAYTLGDNRKVTIQFAPEGTGTKVVEQFEAETQNPVELQQQGWQAILDNFKRYVESH